jgi:hypothetical protein
MASNVTDNGQQPVLMWLCPLLLGGEFARLTDFRTARLARNIQRIDGLTLCLGPFNKMSDFDRCGIILGDCACVESCR